ncbi:MAG TPA: universal stress protein [Gemmatimonadaceae bacterium]
MYKRILVPVENSSYDETILSHVKELARENDASVVLIHVADGWAARNIGPLHLRDSEEIQGDRAYIEKVSASLEAAGLDADAVLASGDPADEIVAAAVREKCDLIAMSTHGHRFIGDLIRGSVANTVRHKSLVPVLMVRGTGPHKEQKAR